MHVFKTNKHFNSSSNFQQCFVWSLNATKTIQRSSRLSECPLKIKQAHKENSIVAFLRFVGTFTHTFALQGMMLKMEAARITSSKAIQKRRFKPWGAMIGIESSGLFGSIILIFTKPSCSKIKIYLDLTKHTRCEISYTLLEPRSQVRKSHRKKQTAITQKILDKSRSSTCCWLSLFAEDLKN